MGNKASDTDIADILHIWVGIIEKKADVMHHNYCSKTPNGITGDCDCGLLGLISDTKELTGKESDS